MERQADPTLEKWALPHHLTGELPPFRRYRLRIDPRNGVVETFWFRQKGLCRVASGSCPPRALARSGQGDFHHPALPLMWLMITFHYLQEFRGHVSQTSMRWPWFPPEVHTNTGRRCSTGSGRHPVPRRPRSYAALRLPHLRRPWRWFPPTSMQRLVLEPAAPAPAYAQRVGDGSPVLRKTGVCRGEVSTSRVTGLSSFERAVVQHPAGHTPLLAPTSRGEVHGETVAAFTQFRTLGIRNDIDFVATLPRPTRLRTYASPTALPRPSQGALPARAGLPLAGRDSHPLDNTRRFMKSSQPPIPFDQHGLVALNFLFPRVLIKRKRLKWSSTE